MRNPHHTATNTQTHPPSSTGLTSGYNQFALIVGRRTALRYAAVGVGAAAAGLLTGCSSSPTTQAVTAFVKGTWLVTIPMHKDLGYTGTAPQPDQETTTVVVSEDGTWTATGGKLSGLDGRKGKWSINAGTASITKNHCTPADDYDCDEGAGTASGVPTEMGGSTSATLSMAWAYSGTARPYPVPITWDGKTLTVTGTNAENMAMAITAVRQ